MRGVVYVAYGAAAQREARLSIESLRRHHGWPVVVVGDGSIAGSRHVKFTDGTGGLPGRWAKVNLDKLSPFEHTLFLDADTRVHGDLSPGFRALERGWDVAIVPSEPQGDQVLAHVGEVERAVTLAVLSDPLQLNTGVMWFRKTACIMRLFEEWRRQWWSWRDKDQGALLRALERAPVRVWLLGRPFNGGGVVAHRFGMARE